MEEIKQFRKIDYKFKGIIGSILISNNIKEEQEIKKICLKDYFEKLSNDIEILS